jgi:dihydrofolate synthase/folylpolyglutamate synthase
MTAALLSRHGYRTGAYLSPHLTSFAERVEISERALSPERFGAAVQRAAQAAALVDRTLGEGDRVTQFEALTAAAYWELARAGVDVAVVEAGLGGRHDATNVLRTRVVLLTNVGLEHTEVLGDTLEAIATEKLAVAPEDADIVLPDDTYEHLVPGREIRFGGARAAAEAFVGHEIAADPIVALPGRFERRDGEVRDGAHNPDGARHLVDQLDRDDHTVVASILGDKDVDAILATLRRAGLRFVATSSSSTRALGADELGRRARAYFEYVEVVDDPVAAVARAHELGEPVLVTGSLYLLGDLAQAEQRSAWRV